MPRIIPLALVLLVTTLAACGGKSSQAGNNGAGATGSGGTGTGGSGTGGTGQAGHAGMGGASVCTSYDDDYPSSVAVSIANQTTMTLYLGQDMVTCGVTPLFQVANADGTPLPDLGDCRSPCVSLRQQGAGGCIGICAFPNTVELKPGEILYTTWDGLFGVPGQLPSKCVPYDTGGEAKVSCDQAKRIEPGTFTFSAHAGSAFDCSQTTGDAACPPCTASPDGGCTRTSSLITGAMHAAQATVALDESYGIYPAPSPPPGASNGNAEQPGAAAVRAVELVFRD